MAQSEIKIRIGTAWWFMPAFVLLFTWTRLTRKMPNERLLNHIVSKAIRVQT